MTTNRKIRISWGLLVLFVCVDVFYVIGMGDEMTLQNWIVPILLVVAACVRLVYVYREAKRLHNEDYDEIHI
jgi:hypothetical protein